MRTQGALQHDLVHMQGKRCKLIGNAVSVPVARWLGERLREPYRYKYITGPRDVKMVTPESDTEGSTADETACALGPWHHGLLQWTGEEGVEDGDYIWTKHGMCYMVVEELLVHSYAVL